MESSIEIDASATAIWDVYSEVERWPEWTESVDHIAALDGPGLAVGRRVQIDQPRFPKLVWEITDVDPGIGWTWVQRSPGGTTTAWHEIVAAGTPGRTLVRMGVEQRGPVGALVGLLARRLTRRHLEAEAEGLKARCERPSHPDVATA